MKIASSLVALCAVLVLGVASLPISTGGSAQAASPSFDHSVQVGNASVAPGATASFTARVTSHTATSASVDFEIYRSDGRKMFEKAYDDEWYNAGQTINHSIT